MPRSGGGARSGVSLRARALRLLAQREHSRLELSRKLGPHAESEAQLSSLLDGLETEGLLSAERFARSLIHRRAGRFGLRRIEQELGTHRLEPEVASPLLEEVASAERDQALNVWRRRFGVLPGTPEERARQLRFLGQRGFTGETIAWVLRHGARGEEGVDDSI